MQAREGLDQSALRNDALDRLRRGQTFGRMEPPDARAAPAHPRQFFGKPRRFVGIETIGQHPDARIARELRARMPWLQESEATEGTFYPSVNPNVMLGLTILAWRNYQHLKATGDTSGVRTAYLAATVCGAIFTLVFVIAALI